MFQQYLFVNGVSVPLPEEFFVRDHRCLTYVLEQIIQNARLPESAQVSFTYEIYYTYDVDSWGNDKRRYAKRFMRMFLNVDGDAYTIDGISEGTHIDLWKYSTAIRLNRDPYGWKDYCFEKRKRPYFGPRKPRATNVIC